MRRIATATFAVLFLIGGLNTPSSMAQQPSQFPWRAGTTTPSVSDATGTPVSTPNGIQGSPVQGNKALDLIPDQNGYGSVVPVAPSMKRNPIFASVRKRQQDDPQPSLSDLDVQGLQVPPAVAVDPNEAPSNLNFQEPQQPFQNNVVADTLDCCDGVCGPPCDRGCVKRIFGTSPNGREIGGWVQIGYHNRDTILFNDRSGKIAPHQIWFYAGKEASRCTEWDVGYRIDALYGLDAQNTQAFGNPPAGAPNGWDNSWDHGAFGWALPQTYFQLANSNWDLKIGKFFSPYGNESVAAPKNFFYSRSYSNILSMPLTLTGILGERRLRHNKSFLLGGSTGWDTGYEQNSGGANLITGFRFHPSQNVSIGLGASYGDTGYRRSGNMNSITANAKLTNNLRYAFQGVALDLGNNQEFGFVNSLFRDVNCCWSLGARLEWWKSDQFTFDTQSTYAFTMGANYRPTANFVVRPELRWDWGGQAVESGSTNFGIDAIMQF